MTKLVPYAAPPLEIIESLPSDQLYALEEAGQIARNILDERICKWTTEGWSQRRIADEIGCSHMAVQRRQVRLGITSSALRAGNQTGPTVTPRYSDDVPDDAISFANPVTRTGNRFDGEVVDGEVVPDAYMGSIAPPVKIGNRMVAGVKFPGGGISETRDVSEYSTADLKRVANDLLRRATPQEAAALYKLFVNYATKAKEQST